MPKASLIHSAVSIQYRLVIDRWTQGHSYYRASIASRGKNECHSLAISAEAVFHSRIPFVARY